MVKSQILKLLTRLIRKLRFILRQGQPSNPDQKLPEAPVHIPEAHFEEICISQQFIKSLIGDIEVAKSQDDVESRASSRSDGTQMLYGSFVQDSVEFLMTIIIPVNRRTVLKSYKDLVDVREDHLKELKEWLDPLMKASMFMHYFNNEIDSLPHDLLQEIHGQT